MRHSYLLPDANPEFQSHSDLLWLLLFIVIIITFIINTTFIIFTIIRIFIKNSLLLL